MGDSGALGQTVSRRIILVIFQPLDEILIKLMVNYLSCYDSQALLHIKNALLDCFQGNSGLVLERKVPFNFYTEGNAAVLEVKYSETKNTLLVPHTGDSV